MITREQAIIIAVSAHAGQLDKQGMPYALHVLRVMFRVPERLHIPAVFHDLIEDTNWTFQDLKRIGVSERDVEIIKLLTRKVKRGESYSTYIARLCESGDRDAYLIKMADLEDNLSRIDGLPEKEIARLSLKYKPAADRLWELLQL